MPTLSELHDQVTGHAKPAAAPEPPGFLESLWQTINPANAVKAALHPQDTAEAYARYRMEHPFLAAIKDAMPMTGGAGIDAGMRIGSGDVRGGLGQAAGDIFNAALPVILPGATKLTGRGLNGAGRIAEAAGEAAAKSPMTHAAAVGASLVGGEPLGKIVSGLGVEALPYAAKYGGRMAQKLGSAMAGLGETAAPEVERYTPNRSSAPSRRYTPSHGPMTSEAPVMEPHAPNVGGEAPKPSWTPSLSAEDTPETLAAANRGNPSKTVAQHVPGIPVEAALDDALKGLMGDTPGLTDTGPVGPRSNAMRTPSDLAKHTMSWEDAVNGAGPDVQVVDQLGPNASGESAASQEAINRQAAMKANGQNFSVFDRGGNERPLIGPDAVDYNPKPGETFGTRDANGFSPLTDNGGRVKQQLADMLKGLGEDTTADVHTIPADDVQFTDFADSLDKIINGATPEDLAQFPNRPSRPSKAMKDYYATERAAGRGVLTDVNGVPTRGN